MKRIKLLNDGGFNQFDVIFPVVVDAIQSGPGYEVKAVDLKNVGFDLGNVKNNDLFYFSVLAGECEVTTNER